MYLKKQNSMESKSTAPRSHRLQSN